MRFYRNWKILLSVGVGLFGFILFIGVTTPFLKEKIPYDSKIFDIGRRVAYKIRDVADLAYVLKMQGESQIPVYEITIKKEDLEKMNKGLSKVGNDRVFSDDMKYSVPANLEYEGKKHDIEIRYRGLQDIHWNADKKSYTVRFGKNDKLAGMKKISLILPLDRKYFVEDLNNYRAEKFGLMHVPGKFVNIKINGKLQGVYFSQEGWSDELLKHINKSEEGRFYKTRDIRSDFCKDRAEYYYCIRKYTALWKQAAGKENDRSYKDLKKLFTVFSIEGDDKFKEEFEKIAHVDKFLKWNVHYLMMQSYHQGISNLRLYSNPETGKFEPVVWDVGMDMNHRHEGIVSDINQVDIKYNPFVDRILQVPEYRHRRNEILWDYVSNGDNLQDELKYYDTQYEKVKLDFYKDRLKRKSNFSFDDDVQRYRNSLVKYSENLRDLFLGSSYIYETDYLGDGLLSVDVVLESFVSGELKEVKIDLNDNLGGNYSIYRDSNENKVFDVGDELVSSVNAKNNRIRFHMVNTYLYTRYFPEQEKLHLITPYKLFIVEQNNKESLANISDIGVEIINPLTKQKSDKLLIK